ISRIVLMLRPPPWIEPVRFRDRIHRHRPSLVGSFHVELKSSSLPGTTHAAFFPMSLPTDPGAYASRGTMYTGFESARTRSRDAAGPVSANRRTTSSRTYVVGSASGHRSLNK